MLLGNTPLVINDMFKSAKYLYKTIQNVFEKKFDMLTQAIYIYLIKNTVKIVILLIMVILKYYYMLEYTYLPLKQHFLLLSMLKIIVLLTVLFNCLHTKSLLVTQFLKLKQQNHTPNLQNHILIIGLRLGF